MSLKPTQNEEIFLTLAYNAFYDLYEEAASDSFWDKDPYYRLCRIRDAYAIYSELLEYEPLKWSLGVHKKQRPPSENMLAEHFFLFVRNLLLHFPIFSSWDEIWFSGALINWSKPGRSIDKFLKKHQGEAPIKYRMWNPKKGEMTYVSIRLPDVYNETNKIFLKDIFPEREGVIFSFSLMKTILDSQVEK
jgi:hypothetical protein